MGSCKGHWDRNTGKPWHFFRYSKPWYASQLPGELVKKQITKSVNWGFGLRICIFNMFLGDAAAGLETALPEPTPRDSGHWIFKKVSQMIRVCSQD